MTGDISFHNCPTQGQCEVCARVREARQMTIMRIRLATIGKQEHIFNFRLCRDCVNDLWAESGNIVWD
jgi:hypothetical protein